MGNRSANPPTRSRSESPQRGTRQSSPTVRREQLQRDPTTGRYLPRGQQQQRSPARYQSASAGRGRRTGASSPPMSGAANEFMEPPRAQRQKASSSPRAPRASADLLVPQIEEQPKRRRGRRAAIEAPEVSPPQVQQRSSSPRQQRKVAASDAPVKAVRASSPRATKASQPRAAAAAAASVTFVDQNGEPAIKKRSPPTQQILRSSYTRCETPEGSLEQQEKPRHRASLAVSRRDYASPSLVTESPKAPSEVASNNNDQTIAPATTRHMRRMSAESDASFSDLAAAPERLGYSELKAPTTSTGAPERRPADMLWSYLNP